MIPSNQYFFGSSGSTPAPEPFGIIMKDDFQGGAGHWLTQGTPGVTFSVDGITIDFSGNNLLNYIYYDTYTGLSNKKFTFSGTVLRNSPYNEIGFVGRAQLDNSSYGNCVELDSSGPVSTYTTVHSPPTAVTFPGWSGTMFSKTLSNGDTFICSLEIDEATLNVSLQVNGGAVQTGTFNTQFYNYPTTGKDIASLSTPFIMPFNSYIKFTGVEFSSTSNKNVARLCVGDSLFKGYYAGSIAGRTANIIGADVNAGGGNTTLDVINKFPELQAQNASKIYIRIGLNDVANSVPTATWKARIDTIDSTLQGYGSQVVWVLYEGWGAFGIAVNDYIKLQFPTRYIDTSAMETSPGVLNPIYDAGDGHLNAAGNAAEAAIIMASPLY